MNVCQSISTTATFAKAVGVWVRQSLRYGCEGQRVERLHGAVVQGGNAQWAPFAVFLRDIDPAQGFGFVSVTFEVICGLEFLSVRSPYYVIYSGRFGASVGCHSPHRQPSGGTRMCQQPLQGQRLAPVAVPDCLGNTHLQPSHLLPESPPMECLPVPWLVERRINSERSCHLLFFLHDGSACSLARRDQTDVGISGALPPALASSVLSMLLLLTRLAVRSARREPGERAAFPCSITIPTCAER